MAKFAYIAKDAAGKETRGTVEAPTQAQAIAKVRGEGLFPTAIGAAGEAAGTAAKKPAAPAAGGAKKKAKGIELRLPKFLRARVKQKDLTGFTTSSLRWSTQACRSSAASPSSRSRWSTRR